MPLRSRADSKQYILGPHTKYILIPHTKLVTCWLSLA